MSSRTPAVPSPRAYSAARTLNKDRAGRGPPVLVLTVAGSASYAPGPREGAAGFWGADGGASPPEAISANRASAGNDLDPVRFMILMRWFSTVRWLMPRSAAMFLLGCPAS